MSSKPTATTGDNTGKQTANPEDFYTRLAVYPYKRRAMITYLVIGFCFFVSLIFKNTLSGNSWLMILGPVVVIGLVITLIPKSEDWEYKAWQSQPRQIERHQIERK
jgi:hypothetical protein